ncbi:MAG: hypothetical protein R2729_32750 [Bryobacteraceae bacterium]
MAATPLALLQRTEPSYLPLIAPVGMPFPRGRISEIHGQASSGRTSLLLNALAQATAQEGDLCAIVDATDAFDPGSAAAAGVLLNRLLWVRCREGEHGAARLRPLEKAFRAVDLLLQANGFGVVVLDMAGADADAANRIPLSYWYRFRRAVEQTRTALLVIATHPQARQCAAFSVEARRKAMQWTGAAGCVQQRVYLESVELSFEPRKPPGIAPAAMQARALAAGE